MNKYFAFFLVVLYPYISPAQNVGIGTAAPTNKLHVAGVTRSDTIAIGTSSPRAPLSFSTALGQKITLWDDGNAGGNNYGIGVQSGLLQIHSYNPGDNISFGYGKSSSLNERMRIINSGEDGLLVNGRILLKNGTLPNDPAQGPGIWLYKPDNLGQLLGFMGAQNNQNIGFYGGPAGWGLTYDAINSRVGINTPNPTSLLNVNGQVTIDQKNFGGYGGLLLKGNVPGSNHPNIAFTIKNNAPAPADVVGAMIQGDLVNNAANAESIDLTFLTANNGFGSLSEKLRIKGTGALAVNGSTGAPGQVITSGGSSAATWRYPTHNLYQNIFQLLQSANLTLAPGSGATDLPNLSQTITLPGNAKVLVSYNIIAGSTTCTFCEPSTLQIRLYLNDVLEYYTRQSISSYSAITTSGSMVFDLPAGTYLFKIKALTEPGTGPSITPFSGDYGKSNLIIQVIYE